MRSSSGLEGPAALVGRERPAVYSIEFRIMVLKEILGKLRPEPARRTAAPATSLRAAEQGQV
jgi:hypothetical protein